MTTLTENWGQYRDYWITFDQKPMADRSHDWNWEHKDYDGPGDERCGTAETEEQAKLDIDEQIDNTRGKSYGC